MKHTVKVFQDSIAGEGFVLVRDDGYRTTLFEHGKAFCEDFSHVFVWCHPDSIVGLNKGNYQFTYSYGEEDDERLPAATLPSPRA